ncbi:Glycylpeptide N-tetradecanoyltransferase [Smittium culicis]|uniref:Glycylpeptide N-tetradecanoyltransferase n=1 Tax=Smittium culicis TaxID=133412 RepID=A0A1R1XQ35_9FUNG|nr:Glycylpeptide N-tetradecanoyltransferase [Smittium culicis]
MSDQDKNKNTDPSNQSSSANSNISAKKQQSLKDSIDATKKQNDAIKIILDQLNLQTLEDTDDAQKSTADNKKKHLFWDSQPVPKPDVPIKKDGPLHQDTPFEKIPKEPVEIPEGYEWCLVDIHNDKEMTELYTLLSKNYVEDSDELFRFHYTPEFLKWGLNPPGQNSNWHIGVREKSKKRELIGFISGIEVEMRVKDIKKRMAEINFLCINKKIRKQRFAPILIKEITRRINLSGIFQAVYTAGIQIPTPFAICQYFHRPLNPKKLVDSGFSHLPPGMTMSRLINKYKIISDTSAQLPGLRPLEERDIPQVRKLINKYLNSRSKMHQVFSSDELTKHWLMPKNNVVYSYVVEDVLKLGKITDFFSFYLLPSTVLKLRNSDPSKPSPKNSKTSSSPLNYLINSAYLFYYGTNPEPAANTDLSNSEMTHKQMNEIKLKDRLLILMYNCLMMAKRENFDVLNCVNTLDNGMILDQLRFGAGDGKLHYYFYNYVANGLKPSDVGLTML